MSYDIETKQWVLEIPTEDYITDKFYIGVSEIGSNNLTDYESNDPVREIISPYAGDGHEFMKQVIKSSLACESGELRLSGRVTRPERYIARWRKMQKEALNISDYLNEAGSLRFRILGLGEKLIKRLDRNYGESEVVSTTRKLEEIPSISFIEEEYLDTPVNGLDVSLTLENLEAFSKTLPYLNKIGAFETPSLYRISFAPWIYESLSYNKAA